MKLFSFDIFDTCISRDCGTGNDLFYLLAATILPTSSETAKRDFALLRQKAEERAILETGNITPSIDIIYKYFPTSLYTDIDIEYIKEKEKALEEDSWVPISKTINLIEKCRHEGKVIFISDMYLPCSFLYPRLRKLGIIEDGETLYVSCDYGKTKRNGDLFVYVSQKENVNFRDWIHYGDDMHNDYDIPRKLGIKAKRIEYKYSNYEKIWYEKGILHSNHALKYYASITRSIRLKYSANQFDEVATNLAIPFFIPTALRFIKDLRRNGVKHIFFASRDMYYMYLAAKIIFGDIIDIKYLHISTKVLYPLLIKEGTLNELVSIFHMVDSFKPITMLKMLDVDANVVTEIRKSFDINRNIMSASKEAICFGELILKYVGKEKLKKTCELKYSRFMDYARQIGLNNEQVALIDLGWRGTSQLVLHELGFNNILYGYFGMIPNRIPSTEMGDSFTYNYCENEQDIDIYRIIVEFYLCVTNQGSTINYQDKDGKMIPVLESVNLDKKEVGRTDFEITTVQEISNRIKHYKSIFNGSENELFDICTMDTISSFAKEPQRQMLIQMQPFLTFSHFGIEFKYLGNIGLLNYLYYLIFRVAKHFKIPLKQPKYLRYYWPVGSMVLGMGTKAKYILQFKTYFKHQIQKLRH